MENNTNKRCSPSQRDPDAPPLVELEIPSSVRRHGTEDTRQFSCASLAVELLPNTSVSGIVDSDDESDTLTIVSPLSSDDESDTLTIVSPLSSRFYSPTGSSRASTRLSGYDPLSVTSSVTSMSSTDSQTSYLSEVSVTSESLCVSPLSTPTGSSKSTRNVGGYSKDYPQGSFSASKYHTLVNFEKSGSEGTRQKEEEEGEVQNGGQEVSSLKMSKLLTTNQRQKRTLNGPKPIKPDNYASSCKLRADDTSQNHVPMKKKVGFQGEAQRNRKGGTDQG
jgi:hypothetical protein